MKFLKLLLIVFGMHISQMNAHAQADSCQLEISLLTCGPGEELYSLFGHSALRIRDITKGTDVVYNYGTFDFDDPDFYVKFTTGKLLYFVSRSSAERFMLEYEYEGRSVIEQVLNLSCAEKNELKTALELNAREENKYYQYDFIFDNCSTRLRDVVGNNSGDNLEFQSFLPKPPPTFRNLLHEYLDYGKQPWSKFGIDLLLGSKIDKPSTSNEAMFLPDYLMEGFDSATVRGQSLVNAKRTLIQEKIDRAASSGFVSPIVVAFALAIVISALGFSRKAGVVKFLRIFDIAFFLLLGGLGVLILFMWFGTDHQLCDNNYNILWATPIHLVSAIMAAKTAQNPRKYFSAIAVLCILVLLAWFFLPQQFNPAFYPLALLAAVRSGFRALKK